MFTYEGVISEVDLLLEAKLEHVIIQDKILDGSQITKHKLNSIKKLDGIDDKIQLVVVWTVAMQTISLSWLH